MSLPILTRARHKNTLYICIRAALAGELQGAQALHELRQEGSGRHDDRGPDFEAVTGHEGEVQGHLEGVLGSFQQIGRACGGATAARNLVNKSRRRIAELRRRIRGRPRRSAIVVF